MLQGLSETQPSSLAKDYSMNEKKVYLFLLKIPETCLDIVGSVGVVC